MSRFTLHLVLPILVASRADAADWPQFLGPKRDASTSEVVKPWKGERKVAWSVPVGEGHSSPVVADGVVYLFAKAAGKNAEVLSAWRTSDGSELGSVSYDRPPFASPFGNGPRSTPTVEGGWVWTYGVTGRLSAQLMSPMNKGSAVATRFSVDVASEFKPPAITFGTSASPLVEGDKIITLVGGKGNGIVAFDRTSGKVMWKATDDAASYSSPMAFGEGKSRQVVCLTAAGLVSLAPADGSVFWRFPFKDLLAESSTTPVVVGDILIASSVTLGSVALKLTEKDGKPSVDQLWKNATLNAYFTTPVVIGEHLYMVNGGLIPPPSATLRCVEVKTGKVLWTRPKVGKYHASLIRTGDNKILMLEEAGDLVLIDPDLSGYKELARAKVCGETWAHPAIANGKLFVRDAKALHCIILGE
jgi:outer membrane protein assembly factor BamB